MCETFGMTVSPDDAYLVLRGIRTLAARLDVHERGALVVAEWLSRHENVARVFCPALPGHPQHDLWRRDCSGTNGLLSIELRGLGDGQVRTFIDSLGLFGIGASWGGFESLVTPCNMVEERSMADWSGRGPVLRLHVGLEDPQDLVEDLRQAFDACACAGA
jgi:cysteine-S-conjugate beta-lyase